MKMPKIRKLDSGNWTCQVMVDGKRKSVTRPTKKEVQIEVMRLKSGDAAEESTPGERTLEAAIENYIAIRGASLSPSTIRGYRIIQENRLKSIMGVKVGKITADMVQLALDADAARLSPKTMRNEWGLLRKVLSVETGREFKPKLPAKAKAERDFLDGDEIKKFISYLENSGDIATLPALLALHSLRESEICGLQWNQIDLDNDLIHVRGALIYDENNVRVHRAQNKTEAGTRDIPIMIPLLREKLEQGLAEGLQGYVVPITHQAIYHRITKATVRAGLRKISPHGLRHSYASLGAELGIPLRIIMLTGGWNDPGTVQRIYTHASERQIAKHTGRIAEFFK